MNGVTFGNKHTFSDWGLIMKSRPEISPPEPKTIYVDIPATDGQIDLTESLTGDVTFKNRTIKCEFTVIDNRRMWASIYSEILDYLQGQRLRMICDDDPSYYYLGRFQVDEWKSNKKTSTIVISGNVEPYKYKIYSTTENWLWDTFNFETDMIVYYVDVPYDSSISGNSVSLSFYCERKKVVPRFTFVTNNSEQAHFTFKGKNYYFESGVATKNPNIVFTEGWNTIHIWGTGTCTCEYQNGRL